MRLDPNRAYTEIGAFTLSAESQCREEHRSICNHNATSQIIEVTN
jgi:hypothetical protein